MTQKKKANVLFRAPMCIIVDSQYTTLMPLKLFLAKAQKLLIPSYPPTGYMFSLRLNTFSPPTHTHTQRLELRLTLQNLLADSTLDGFL